MTVHHYVFSKFKPGLSDADKKKAFNTAFELVPSIPGVRNFKAGPPVSGAMTQGYGFALTAEFDDFAAFKKYLAHPEHVKLLKVLGPLTEGKGMISYQIDSNTMSKL